MGAKELLKKKIEESCDQKYKKEVEVLDLSFDEWIRKKEEKLERFDMTIDLLASDAAISNTERLTYCAKVGAVTVRIIPYSSLKGNLKIANYLEDILIFVNGALTDKAIPLLLEKFEEHTEVSLLYGDEDIANLDVTETSKYGKSVYGTRRDPYFKPEWSPNAFLDHFYFCNIVAMRRIAFRDVSWSDKDGAEGLYETLLKYIFDNEVNLRKSVEHINEILVHCDDYKMNELKIEESGKYAAKLLAIESKKNEISVIIPSKDNPHLLVSCLDSLFNMKEPETETEIIVVDNGSSPENRKKISELSKKYGFKYIYEKMEFNFPKMINIGAKEATKPLLLILNDDITFTERGSIEKLAAQVKWSFTGASGVKLLYPDSTIIQHAGVINTKIGPVHKLQFMDDNISHYHGFNKMVQNVSAVTGACIMVRREVFFEVRGMDEPLRVAFNDIDFCFRLLEAGYVNVVLNNISLCHAESVTRGNDSDEASLVRLKLERKSLYSKHPRLRGYDPYYSERLLTDCLDSRIVPASEYEYSGALETHFKPIKVDLTSAREEKCLRFSAEFADNLSEYTFDENDADSLYLQGFAYVQGSNNACYEKRILLQSSDVNYALLYKGALRKDISIACPGEKNVERSGFSLKFDKDLLPKGTYRVGVYFKRKFSKEKLYVFSNKYLEVK